MAKKRYVPFMERLTPEQRRRFDEGMARLRRQFMKKMQKGAANGASCAVPPCDICGREQAVLGGIEFGPPRKIVGLPGMWCRKLHVCSRCTRDSEGA